MLADRHVRPQGKGLEYHAQIPLFYGNHMALAGINLIVEADNAGSRFNETAYNAQKRGLAAAGGAQDGDKLAVLDVQVNFLECLGFVEAFCYLLYM